MIVVEEKLRDLFDMIPEIEINASNLVKPCFSWGDEGALRQFMVAAYNIDVNFNLYPLIWLLPSKDDNNPRAKTLTKKVSLVISTLETRDELLNDQRLQGTFKNVLNPLSDYIEQCFLNSSITLLQSNIETFKHPNYSVNKKSGSIDKWDAMRIDCEVEFNSNCLKPIKWT